MAHQAGAYLSFYSMKRLGVVDRLDSMQFIEGLPPALSSVTHLYTWVERGTVRVKCLAQAPNIWPQPGDILRGVINAVLKTYSAEVLVFL